MPFVDQRNDLREITLRNPSMNTSSFAITEANDLSERCQYFIDILLHRKGLETHIYDDYIVLKTEETPSPEYGIAVPMRPTTTEQSEKPHHIYDSRQTDIRAEFPKGREAFDDFFYKHFVKPEELTTGTVGVIFVVERDGILTDIRVTRDLGYDSGKEAVRVLKMSPKWKPAVKSGNPVRSHYELALPVMR